METLGGYLKNQRESRSVTLEEVAEATKIRKTILKAIEGDRHDLLPPRVFTQGFLKIYASYLELDESEVVRRYQEVLEKLQVDENEEESERQKSPKSLTSLIRVIVEKLKVDENEEESERENERQKSPKSLSSLIRAVVLFTIVVLALAFWYFLSPQKEKKISVSKDSPQESVSKSVESPPVIKPLMPETKDEEKVVSVEKELDAPVVGEDRSEVEEAKKVKDEQMVLRVLSSETTWIEFQLDDDELFDVLLKSGESFRVKAHEKFNLRIGNAGGVELFLNDKALGNPGKRGEVIDLTLPE
ncbi:MAG: helix-turn-helix domain-containing protein [Deltaproteobacteria bacterium]|nr:helix-turn-helix domain-containing protein [Deltaproteobacteria bacterium]